MDQCNFCGGSGVMHNQETGDEAVCHCSLGDVALVSIQEKYPQFYEGYLRSRSTGVQDSTEFLAQR